MSSTDRGRVSVVRETTAGVTPTNPTFQIVRALSSSLAYNKQTIESNEIDSSGQPSDTVKVGASSSGNIAFELSGGSWDALIEAAFRGTFDAVINHTGVVTVTASSGTIVATGAFGSAKVGQWVLLEGMVGDESYAGAGDSPNNGWWKILTNADANTITVDDPGSALVNETGPSSATIKSKRLLNGVVSRTHSIEESFTDVDAHILFKGQYCSGMSLNLSAGQIVTGEFQFMGTDVDEEQLPVDFNGSVTITATTRTVAATGAFVNALPGQKVTLSNFTTAGNNTTGVIATVVDDDSITLTAATTTLVDETDAAATITWNEPSWLGAGSHTAVTTTDVMNATNDVGQVIIDGEISTSCFRSLQFTLTHNMRETQCVGAEFPRIDYGTPALTGSMEKLFADLDLFQTMRSHGSISLEFGFISADKKNGIHISLPSVNIDTDALDLSGGKNSDVYDRPNFSAHKFTNAASETYYAQICIAG